MPIHIAASPVVAIVDDDDAVCRALAALLGSAGHRTRCFSSGRAFLDAAATEDVGCAVLDVKMPGLDGPEVLAALHRMGHEVPAIFVTAHDSPTLRIQLLASGGRACFGKPVDPQALVAAVRACLAERCRRQP